jgi:hypothetical protein
VAQLAAQVFDELNDRHAELIRGLRQDLEQDNFEEWCGRRSTLNDLTILDSPRLRERIFPDFRLEHAFGERPPVTPQPGYLDALPPESENVAFFSAVPGAVFRAVTGRAVDIDTLPPGVPPVEVGNRFYASLVMPGITNVFTAKLGLFALDNHLSVAGAADGVVPLFRYEHMRDKAKELIAHIQTIESRMLPIQFELDDFAEAMDVFRRPLAAQQAELEAVKQRIVGLTQGMAALVQVEKALVTAIDALDAVEEECECDWFCWLVTIAVGILLATAAVAAIAASVGTGFSAIGLLLTALNIILPTLSALFVLTVYEALSCQNVTQLADRVQSSLNGVRAGIAETEAEFSHA